ncbi:MAG: Hsp20/alpha crystallin family protein [Clostridia bacterium]|nr:Hsp20/alpha crystallin family protein [Clostridia bacterium]
MMYTVLPYRRPVCPELMADRFMREFCGMPARAPRPGFRVDVRREPEAFILEAELPGVKLDDITITVEDDVLTIAADVNTHKKEEHDGYVYSERRSGHVERRFSLEGIRQEGITAASADGVLTITLPKEQPEAAKEPRRIAINAAAPAIEAAAEE